jgi:phage terminase large subunit-like protein
MGAAPAVSEWDTSCRDWQARIKAGRSLIPKLPLDEVAAKKAVGIFNHLRLPDVVGQPMMATAAGEWQRDIVRALFGSWEPETLTRHIREFFVLVPKKNSKTTAGAAIMVTALLMNRRPRAEFLLIAPTQEIADLAFRQAAGMIGADPALKVMFNVQDYIKRISLYETGAFLKVKSFDPKIVTGSKPSGILLDELHVIAGAAEADRVIGQIRGGMLPNPEAFMVTITTQGERPPAGVFRAELSKARKVRDGEARLPILPVIYEFPRGIDWRDPQNWRMVTPNDGLSVSVKRLLPDYHAAVEAGEDELRRWASQHLNVEIGLSLRSDRWLGAEYWEAAADPALTLDAILERSEVVTIGIDGGGADDLLGLAVIGRDRHTRQWLHWAHAWAHPLALERRKSESARYRDLAQGGDLTIIAEYPEDLDGVVDVVRRINEAGLLGGVGVDTIGLAGIVDALADIGVTEDSKQVAGIGQGYVLTGAIKGVERKLIDGSFRHGGQALMTWCVGNAKVEPTKNAFLITKQASGTAKIDPLMATFDAAKLMERNPMPIQAPAHQMLFVA